MKLLFPFLALVALAASAPASAQNAPVYRYCLQQNFGFLDSMTLCRYQTMQQCWASKTGSSDFCYPNPAYPGSSKARR